MPRFCIGAFWTSGWTVCLGAERHLTVSLYSNAYSRSWGAVLIQDSQRLVSRDGWSIDSSEDINVLESKALLNALVAFRALLETLRFRTASGSEIDKISRAAHV